MRILVVDDEPAVRESLERSLRFEGYEVVAAGDGVEALERVREDEPDAVVLEVLMPRLYGLEACRWLRARGDDLPALLRRTGQGAAAARLAFADLTMDPGTREVRRGERPIDLTRTEFALLELFLRHPRQVLIRSILLEKVWGFDFETASNSLEVYVGHLRRKTETGGEPRLLHTVRGIGYVLREPPP